LLPIEIGKTYDKIKKKTVGLATPEKKLVGVTVLGGLWALEWACQKLFASRQQQKETNSCCVCQ